jgi:DnaJ-class molecular chaperone
MACNVCSGEGGWDHLDDEGEVERYETCQECGGKGYLEDDCPHCDGTGYLQGEVCEECDGTGERY